MDGGSFSNASGTNSWSFSLDTASLSNATHTLTAKVTDSSGSTALSTLVSITVNNAAGPTVTVNWSDVHQQIDGFELRVPLPATVSPIVRPTCSGPQPLALDFLFFACK